MRRPLAFGALAVALIASASAQVSQYVGPSANLPSPNLDFDNPPVPSGPISGTDPAFTSAGVTMVTQLGFGWASTGDTTSPGISNNALQGVISQGGVLAIGGDTAGTPLDNPGPGDGWEITLAAPVDEFQCIFTDQVNMNYDVELIAGGTSIGFGSFNYSGGFPNPPHFWRGTAPFDTIRITFPNGSGGVGIDEWAWGNGPAPQPPTNDDCATATNAVLGSNAFNNLNATASAAGSSCGADNADVWFSFTVPTAGNYRFETCGSSLDTVLEVYSGSCGSATSLGCNDDACGAQSQLDIAGLAAGANILIQVGGFGGAQGSGSLEISNFTVAPNDDCATAAPVAFGPNPIDNNFSTAGSTLSGCGADQADVWYSFTVATAGDYRFETCGSLFDTVLEVYTGSCGALVSQGCNDDTCGTGSRVDVLGLSAGDIVLLQVGGFGGAQGLGTLTVGNPPPPPPANCARTLFASNNGGATGGAVYFDMTLSQASSFSGMLTNTSAAAGSPIGVSIYTCMGSYAGQETNPGAWTLVAEDDGSPISLGDDVETPVTFLAPFSLPAGVTGIAVVGDNFTTGLQMDHDYTNGTGANQNFVSVDGVVTLDLGTATNVPFTGSVFSPRVWNGQFCHGGAVAPGSNYCQANANSTGVPASMGASGSNIVGNNDLVLEANDLPLNSFGFFLTSTVQGFVAGPGGSQGNLCLGGAIGRYVGAGQIQNSGSAGMISLAIDNTQVPQPTGFVAIAAGETWSFQLWNRDAVGGSATSNFTDGYEITFQ